MKKTIILLLLFMVGFHIKSQTISYNVNRSINNSSETLLTFEPKSGIDCLHPNCAWTARTVCDRHTGIACGCLCLDDKM